MIKVDSYNMDYQYYFGISSVRCGCKESDAKGFEFEIDMIQE